MLMYSSGEVPVHPAVLSEWEQLSESTARPRKWHFTVSQVWNDSLYLQGFKLEVAQVARLGNCIDLSSITIYK